MAILVALSGSSLAWAEPAPSTAGISAENSQEAAEISTADQEIIDRILDLQRQIQDLRDQLSAASRALLDEEHFDQDLARLTADKASDSELSAPTAPESAIETEPASQPTAEPEPEAGRIPRPVAEAETDTGTETRPTDDACNTLRLFDTTGDGTISGSDRFWRYLQLWIDGNRDGILQESEVQHPFDFGIIEISGRLSVFHTDKKVVGDIRRTDRLYFEPLGKENETGILMVDATRIQRGDGLTLLTEDLEVLEGLQAFRPGLSLRDAGGETLRLNCP